MQVVRNSVPLLVIVEYGYHPDGLVAHDYHFLSTAHCSLVIIMYSES